jgi:hypothetical protein
VRQLIEQKLIPAKEEVLQQTKVAYQLKQCATLHEYDTMLQDLDLELAHGYLERAAYGVLLPHLMKEMIPDTGGRYYFIPLLPVGSPPELLKKVQKVIQPGECASTEAYRDLLGRYFPATENCPLASATNAACVLKCGRAIAVMQSRENLYEKQHFAVELPAWVTGLRAQSAPEGLRLEWPTVPESRSYRVWKRIEGARVYPQWELVQDNLRTNACTLAGISNGTFAITALTGARRVMEGTVNYTDYLLFQGDESSILEEVSVDNSGSHTHSVTWTDESLAERQEVWRILEGVSKEHEREADAVLAAFRTLITAFEAKDLDRLMSFYDSAYRDSNGYSTEYVRRAWRWWFQRTVIPYVVAQVRSWNMSRAAEGIVSFTAWNRFRGTIVWDEPFGYHGRVRIPRHDGDRVTWTWERKSSGEWKVIRTEPALPNFGEMLWISRGHDVKHVMADFADTPASHGK